MVIIVCLSAVGVTGYQLRGFGKVSYARRTTARFVSSVAKVTSEDVEEACEKAERLWAEALEARKLADERSIEADNIASAAADASKEQSETLDAASKFNLALLSGASEAMNSSLEAGQALSDAVEAAEAAEKLELLAEAALQETEKLLTQHEIDYPEGD